MKSPKEIREDKEWAMKQVTDQAKDIIDVENLLKAGFLSKEGKWSGISYGLEVRDECAITVSLFDGKLDNPVLWVGFDSMPLNITTVTDLLKLKELLK